jgi:hypothetical protein
MAAWQQELWRRQRAHLAAHEEDATTPFVRAPLTAVAQHHSHGVASTTTGTATQAAKRLRSPRYNSGPASNKLRRSDQDDHISAATKNDNKKEKKSKKSEKGKEKLHQVVAVDEVEEDIVDENETTTTATTRSKKKRSSSFKRAVEKIKHMTTSRHEEEGEESEAETDEDGSALRPPQTQHSLAATHGVYDLGANQVNALAWYQRLFAAARPQRAS